MSRPVLEIERPRTRAVLALVHRQGPMTRVHAEDVLGIQRGVLHRVFEVLREQGYIAADGVEEAVPGKPGKRAVVYRALQPASSLPTLTDDEIREMSRVNRNLANQPRPKNDNTTPAERREIERQRIEERLKAYRAAGGKIDRLPAPDGEFRPLTQPIGSNQIKRGDE